MSDKIVGQPIEDEEESLHSLLESSPDSGSEPNLAEKQHDVNQDNSDDDDDSCSDGGSESSFEDPRNAQNIENNDLGKEKRKNASWSYRWSRREGRVIICGEWKKYTKYKRDIVIGPDWPCVMITYFLIVVLGVLAISYLVNVMWELWLYAILLGLTLYSLSVVFLADPGLLRKYHHARKMNWTYCDHCHSVRMPGTVHCSTCQVCIAGYDHHCPWTGKCIGQGTIIHFKIFAVAISMLILFTIILGVLNLALPGRLTRSLV